MNDYFNSVGIEWMEEYTRKANANSDGSVVIDVVSSVNQYTVQVISNTTFGGIAGVIKNPECKFMRNANALIDFDKKQIVKLGLKFLCPRLATILGLSTFDMSILAYFENLLKRELTTRMNGENVREDFLHLLVQAKKGELKAAGVDELCNFEKDVQLSEGEPPKKQYLTDEIMIAEFIVFFLAYFVTGTTISFVFNALALHKDVQERLRAEVGEIVKEDGTFDYDDLGQLVYLDMVVNEVLRVTSNGRIERLCVKDYKDPESGLAIPKGTVVAIPVCAMHKDKQYFHNPEEFDPEHFSPERKAERNRYAFLPFGTGPRSCVAMHFALTEVKAAVAHVVHSFILEPTANTSLPFQVKPSRLHVTPPKNLELKLTPVDKN